MNEMTPDRGIGDNRPPDPIVALRQNLDEKHKALLARRDELLGGIARAPGEIDTEETAGVLADFVDKQVNAFLKQSKAVHETEKAPHLAAGRAVDAFWHSLVDDVERGKKALNAVRKRYADAKAAAERRRREEEARKARAEQERLAREAAERAAALQSEEELEDAIAAEEAAKQARLDADRAAKEAAAKPAELGKSRGDYGGQTSLRQFWNFRDLDRSQIDLEALRHHISTDCLEKALRSWINANKDNLKAGARLAGVSIFEDTRL